MDLHEYVRIFEDTEQDYERAVASLGLPFEEEESAPRAMRDTVAEECGCHIENATSSIWRTWISPACFACRTGEKTASLFTSLKCTKSCYFCFNVNQESYTWHLTHERDIVHELEQAHAGGAKYKFLAVTGGEPLLHKDKTLAFIKRANELYPGVHTRIYTNGDLLDPPTAQALAEAGLAEVRLSVKPPEEDRFSKMVYKAIENAVAAIPDVVIEVPVIPGSIEQMKEMMTRAAGLGVRGINLLEFCFPMGKADEYLKRGFKLRRRPYRYMYNYGYEGGAPVAGSERDALELVRFAAAELPSLGVHYCSVENRVSAQVSMQNRLIVSDKRIKKTYPWMSMDGDGPFLKCAKAFGDDVAAVSEWARREKVPHSVNESVPSIVIPLAAVEDARAALPHVEFGKSIDVLQQEKDGTVYMVEVGIDPLA